MTTTIRILYWKEVPVQVEAYNDDARESRQLEPRFQEAADAIAMFDGSAGSDEYLDAWDWHIYATSDDAPVAAASALADRINSGMPRDFVARIRDAHVAGTRDPSPGAINHWIPAE